MKKIVFAVMGLLALFTILRAYGEEASEGARFILHPGVLEFSTPEASARIAFGLLDRGPGEGRVWNLLPVQVTVRAGKQSFTLSLNGLALAAGGVRLGRPVRVAGRRSGDVISLGGPVTVAGTVDGDVWTLGADVRLLAQSVVTGSVVALGGTVQAERGAQVRGNKFSLPDLKIPFLRLASSGQSAATFRFLVELVGVFLYLAVLFLAVHFARERLSGLAGALASYWKGSLLYLVLALLLLPLLVALLAATILGIVLVPLLAAAVIVLAYLGFVGVTVRVGLWLRRQKGEGGAGMTYASGLLGLLLVKGPALLGLLLTLLAAAPFPAIGRFLFAVGTIEMAAAALYGFGGTLQYLRVSSGPR